MTVISVLNPSNWIESGFEAAWKAGPGKDG